MNPPVGCISSVNVGPGQGPQRAQCAQCALALCPTRVFVCLCLNTFVPAIVCRHAFLLSPRQLTRNCVSNIFFDARQPSTPQNGTAGVIQTPCIITIAPRPKRLGDTVQGWVRVCGYRNSRRTEKLIRRAKRAARSELKRESDWHKHSHYKVPTPSRFHA